MTDEMRPAARGVTPAEPPKTRAKRPRLGPSIGWVLAVDDDPSWTKLLESRLRDLVRVVVANRVLDASYALEAPGLVAAIVDGVLDHRNDRPDGIDEVAIPAKRRYPDAQIWVVTSVCPMDALRRAQRAGCLIATKDVRVEEIRRMAKEWRAVARVTDAATARIERFLQEFMSHGVLTIPQAEHVRLAARGASNVEIARELECSTQSIEAMSRRIQRATGLTTKGFAHELCRGTIRLPGTVSSTRMDDLLHGGPATGAHPIRRGDDDVG